MTTKRAAIYVRVSTDRQEENGTSLKTQEEKCLEYCKDRKYLVKQENIYRDVWTGTEYYERPELTKLREDARNNKFDVVIIYAFDRLARKQVHQAVIIEDLRQKSVNLESVTEAFDDSAIGQFMRNAAAFAAELEHEKIRERTQRGIMSKLRNGQLQGTGEPTYGYLWNEDRTKYLINQDEAKIVKLIFDLYTNQGYSIHKVVLYLRENNIPNRNQERKDKDGVPLSWGVSGVHRMLSNTYYIGKGKNRKFVTKKIGKKHRKISNRPEEERFELAEGLIPAIIDEDMFLRAQEKLAINKRRATRNNLNPEASLLRGGYAICGTCGYVLRTVCRKKKYENGHVHEQYIYNCYDRHSVKRCNKLHIDLQILDDAAWEYIETLIADETKVELRLKEIEAELTKHNYDLAPIDEQITTIDADMQNCAKGIIKAKDDYTIDLLTTESEKLSLARKDLEKLRDDLISKSNNVELVREKLNRFRYKWFSKATQLKENATYLDKREACEILGIQAIVYPHGHRPRYEFKLLPPEIESLTTYGRAQLRGDGVQEVE